LNTDLPSLTSKHLVLATLGLTLVVFTVFIPSVAFDVPRTGSSQGPLVRAGVVNVEDLGTQPVQRGVVHSQRIHLQLESGETVSSDRSLLESEMKVMPLKAGDDVYVAQTGTPSEPVYFVADYARGSSLLLLATIFIAVVLVVARGHGIWSLLGLGASLLVILRFIIPGILAGYDPVLIAFFGALVIMTTTLFLAHGVSWKSTVALAGTAFSLVLAIVLSAAGIDFAKLSGLISEEATTLNLLTEGGIDARGLLLGGIIIGALGVLDDVTIAQASAVFELRRANPDLDRKELVIRGMNVGRDHIAATVNTLFLAYAGAALPLLIILATQTDGFVTTSSQELVATEIVRSLIGGIAITAAVPITTALAATVAASLGEFVAAPEDWSVSPEASGYTADS
jgi:uncharacterized membrane protein